MTALALLLAVGLAGQPASSATAADGPGPPISDSSKRGPPRSPAWYKPGAQGTAPAHPRRVVSLAPVVTETAFRLGRGDRVVGATRFCDRPAEALALPRVGGYVDISLERVLALHPDVVIAMPSLGQREVLDRLRDRGVAVRVVFADTLDEVRDLIHDLGALLEAIPAAEALNAEVDRAVASVRELRLPPRRAAVVVGHDPIVIAGPGTFAAEVLALTGLAPAFSPDAPMWPVWSVESLAAARADILIAAEGPEAARKLRALLERAVPAARRPVVVEPGHTILMRPGPSLIEDLDELRKLLSAHAAASGTLGPPGRTAPR